MGIVSIIKSSYNNNNIRPYNLRDMVKFQDRVRIVVGAAADSYEGWISTEEDRLSLLHEADWVYHFGSNPVDAILAEHVWEHLDCFGAIMAAQNCFKYLKPGGYMRVAVPDGWHPDKGYIDRVKPGGWGAGSKDHHVLYTYTSLRTLFALVGFDILLLEYFDECGTFHYLDWSPTDGMVKRSKRFDSRNHARELAYTSIILDARKPV
jgi:predicted SAM-dependent methyltransferase